MYYHSPQFQNIADQAAAYARPLILQTIRDLVPDFLQKYPDVLRLDCSTGRIEGHREKGIVRNAEWLEMSKETPIMYFLLDCIHKYTIGFCPDITLQPVLMIDGVPMPTVKCNMCSWEGCEEDLKEFVDSDGYGHGCPKCDTDSYLSDLTDRLKDFPDAKI